MCWESSELEAPNRRMCLKSLELVSLLIKLSPSDSPSSDNCFYLCLLIGLVCLCGLLSLSVRVETSSLRVDTRQVQDVYQSRNRADRVWESGSSLVATCYVHYSTRSAIIVDLIDSSSVCKTRLFHFVCNNRPFNPLPSICNNRSCNHRVEEGVARPR